MHVFIDDSGCGGFKFANGSSSHLVIAACVFRDPGEIEHLAACVEACKAKNRHKSEFKYSKTKERVRDCFFECTSSVDFAVRAIVIDKAKIYSPKLRGSPSALKSYAIRMLLTKTYGQVINAKIVVDGQDTKAFDIRDAEYFTRMVERESPGTIREVKFDDSSANVGIQLADMVAGAINRGVRTHRPADNRHLLLVHPRTYLPRGTLWHFT